MSMLCWGGFSAQSIASKSSPLQKLYGGDHAFSPLVSLNEKVSGSLSPAFSDEGYPRSDLTLIVDGKADAQLVSSRSAAEYGLIANGASGDESPSALNMEAGSLPEAEILKQLGTGLYISNLWYLNYSDQPAARLTGMTRFATFWVEDGEIKAPVSTMRFDDSVFSLLGSQLEALTPERELLLSASTYSQRATASELLPGALVSTTYLDPVNTRQTLWERTLAMSANASAGNLILRGVCEFIVGLAAASEANSLLRGTVDSSHSHKRSHAEPPASRRRHRPLGAVGRRHCLLHAVPRRHDPQHRPAVHGRDLAEDPLRMQV